MKSESEKKKEVETIKTLVSLTGDNPEQKSDEWFIQRATLFTASPACLIMGHKDEFFGTTRKDYLRKKIRAIKAKCENRPLPSDAIGEKLINKFVHHGTIFEDIATKLFNLANPYANTYEARLVENPAFPYLGVSPDGYVIWKDESECALLEIKCPYSNKNIHEVRDYYNDQMQMQMMVTGISRCFYFAVIIKTSKYGVPAPKRFVDLLKTCDRPLFGGALIKPIGSNYLLHEQIYTGGFVGKNEKFKSFQNLGEAIQNDDSLPISIPEIAFFVVDDYSQIIVRADLEWQKQFEVRYGKLIERIIKSTTPLLPSDKK